MGVKPGPVDAMVVLKPKLGATTASGLRSTLYKAYSGELPHPATLNPGPAYAGMKSESLPLICTSPLTSHLCTPSLPRCKLVVYCPINNHHLHLIVLSYIRMHPHSRVCH
ncbi:hypothetical protein ATANTOWER_026152 [Ataeniobius toweri]|uniref:Uncharacterized protein n=1 Tax=Ataeniobius toweri TaxID=208326 RepID=A0ABU7C3Z4_9TELE|nr:hypothetical protein [Ataeniobius toweri]